MDLGLLAAVPPIHAAVIGVLARGPHLTSIGAAVAPLGRIARLYRLLLSEQ